MIDDVCVLLQIRFILLQNRQGKTRLAKYYIPLEDSEKHKLEYEVKYHLAICSFELRAVKLSWLWSIILLIPLGFRNLQVCVKLPFD